MPNNALHIAAQQHLQQHIKPNMHESSMQKDWRDEAEPLVWRWSCVKTTTQYGCRNAIEAAKLAECALGCACCGVWTGPDDCFVGVLYALLVAHAGDVAGAHVDEDVGGGTEHGVYGTGLKLGIDSLATYVRHTGVFRWVSR